MATLLRVRTTFTGLTGSPWLSTSWFLSASTSATQAEADAAVLKVGTFWGAADAHMNTSVNWATEAQVGELDTGGVLVGGFATTPQTGSGGTATASLPPATQILLRLLTGVFLSGRQLRGRLFVPGITEAGATLGVPSSGTLSAIVAAANVMAANTAPRLAVWSRTNAAATAATSVTGWSQFAVLRSRRD